MRYLTAGESHGPRLTAIIEGVPAGLPLTAEDINGDLKRRQGGYGRGGRMKISLIRLKSLLVFVMGKQQGLQSPFMSSIRIIKNGWTSWLWKILRIV